MIILLYILLGVIFSGALIGEIIASLRRSQLNIRTESLQEALNGKKETKR